jgi:hypothetical protein
MNLRGLVPNFHIHVSVNYLYITMIGPPFCCSKIGGPIAEIYKSLTDTVHECRHWERGRAVSFLEYLFLIFGTVHLPGIQETQQPLLSSTYMFFKGYCVIYVDRSGNTEVVPVLFCKSRDLLSKRSHCFFFYA